MSANHGINQSIEVKIRNVKESFGKFLLVKAND